MDIFATARLFVIGRIFIEDKEKEKNKIVKREALWFDESKNNTVYRQTDVHNSMN